MNGQVSSYKISNYAILLTVIIAIGISYFFKWNDVYNPVNFMDGDAKDYYSYLMSIFINHDLSHQTGNDWFLLKTVGGTINAHLIGVSLLELPFFLMAYAAAALFHFPIDGMSFPFQLAVAIASLTYVTIGLFYLKKLFAFQHIQDKTTAIILVLIFFGTNLMHYTLAEAGMSHIYSFSLISVFLYHSSKFVLEGRDKNLIVAACVLGLILLVRPNNAFVVLTVFIWFRSIAECKLFFITLLKNKHFYLSVLLVFVIVFAQSCVWYLQNKHFFNNNFSADGFYWFHPQIIQMLFGFDNGFFIYTPLCFLFLFGLPVIFKENKFSFFAIIFLLAFLFYFFASHWAYTYFDGFSIRVLVDYYPVFAFVGAKLWVSLSNYKILYTAVFSLSLVFAFINLIYTYQGNRSILLRSGMNFKKWKYIFLKTDAQYQNCLGGVSDLKPFSKIPLSPILSAEQKVQEPFNFDKRDYGLGVFFDSIGFVSNRIQLAITVSRKEVFANASKDALICVSLDDTFEKKNKSYFNIKLNEVPSTDCCQEVEYHYTANMNADFKPSDHLSVFIWNTKLKAFFINKFSVQVYNYNYQTN